MTDETAEVVAETIAMLNDTAAIYWNKAERIRQHIENCGHPSVADFRHKSAARAQDRADALVAKGQTLQKLIDERDWWRARHRRTTPPNP